MFCCLIYTVRWVRWQGEICLSDKSTLVTETILDISLLIITSKQSLWLNNISCPLDILFWYSLTGVRLSDLSLCFHCYADDILTIYLNKTRSNFKITKLTECVRNVKYWMNNNFLQLNLDETKILLIGPKKSVNRISWITICKWTNILLPL